LHHNPTPLQARGKRNLLAKTSALTALLVLTSGCVVDSGNPSSPNDTDEGAANPNSNPSDPDPSGAQETIASTSGSSTRLGEDLVLDVYALERVGSDLLRLQAGITNNSGSSFPIYDAFSDTDDPFTASQISLIDTKNQSRHLSFDQSDGTCFCLPFNTTISAGETLDTWVVFPAPPNDIDTMIVTTPVTPPLLDVPITTAAENIENPGISDPEILDLTTISDNLEDQTGRTETSDEVSIILSSDVLFETNSAELSPSAQEILEQVSIEVDDASATVVNIDGHADDTGSDSVNVPLSQARAEAVEEVLSGLVTRNGVTFDVAGHGSSDPIADNDTEDGRERNRRVSVTFEK